MSILIAGASLTASAQAPAAKQVPQVRRIPAFSYDKAALPTAKPWTAKKFANSPRNF